jgi:hypothetical protein
LFVGRIQPLKAPDVVLRAAAAPIPLLAPVTTAIRGVLTVLRLERNRFDPFGQD